MIRWIGRGYESGWDAFLKTILLISRIREYRWNQTCLEMGKKGGDNSQSRVFRLLPRLIRWFYGILSGCIYLCDGLGRLRVWFLLCWLILMVVITDYMVQSVSIALRIFNILSESFGSLRLSTYHVGWLALFVGMDFKARYWLFSSE